jgi:hypothetical protein
MASQIDDPAPARADEPAPGRAAHTLNQLTAMGHGSRGFLYAQIGLGLLVTIKCGKKTLVTEEQRKAWLANCSKAKIAPPKPKKQKHAA